MQDSIIDGAKKMMDQSTEVLFSKEGDIGTNQRTIKELKCNDKFQFAGIFYNCEGSLLCLNK